MQGNLRVWRLASRSVFLGATPETCPKTGARQSVAQPKSATASRRAPNPRSSELRLGLVRRKLAADHRHEPPVVALNADQLLKRACNVIDRPRLDRCTPLIAHPDTSGAPCRSSRAARCRGLR